MVARHVGALALAFACSGVLGGPVQAPLLVLPPDAATYRQQTIDIFNSSWNAYKQYAYGHDDLSPVSKSYSDSYGGWAASLVDGLDTMWIMGLTDIFEESVNYTSHIDFTTSNTGDTVDLFETTIRYVASALVSYDLSGRQYPQLLKQAQVLVDKMTNAFVGDNAVPYGYLNWNNGTPATGTSNIAEAGTLTMEWATLAGYTGNDTYRVLAEKPVRYIAGLTPPLPGLPAQGIDPASGQFVGGYVTWGGGSDSYFEYLIKYARLTNTDDNFFADAWATAVDTSLQVLAKKSSVGGWQYLADYDDGQVIHVGSHLECFHAGNWMLGGKLLNNDTIVNFALDLMEACWNTYASTTTGIGPEVFGFFSSDGNYTGLGPSNADLEFYKEHGFFVDPSGTDYYLRPEVLESNFYAWRVTGDPKYVERAGSALQAFQKYLPTTVAYAGINDVDSTDSGFIDDMQSFWFAEVLKYLFLTFDDPSNYSLDEYIFNTEGHPFKAPPAKPVYGSGSIMNPTGTFVAKTGPLPVVSPGAAIKVPLQ
ncbi:glycoside hydrolase [Amylocystis lapponica]|nr:glycoside hydrolase [Amylocystis lapponica]